MPAFPSTSVGPWPSTTAVPDHSIQGSGESLVPRSDPRRQPLAGQQYNGSAPDTTLHTSTANPSPPLGRHHLQFIPGSLNYDSPASVAVDPVLHETGLQETPVGIPATGAATNKVLYGHDPEVPSITPFPSMASTAWDSGQSLQSFAAVWPRPGVESAGVLKPVHPEMPMYSSESIPSLHLAHFAAALPAPTISYEAQVGASAKAVEASPYSDKLSSGSAYKTCAPTSTGYNQPNTLPLPDGAPGPGPSSRQSQYWVLQPSLGHGMFRQSPLKTEGDQMLSKLQVSESSFPSSVTASSSQASAYLHTAHMKNTVEDAGTSDLEEMTRLWLISHVSCYDDALNHVPLEELGKQVMMIGVPSFAVLGNGPSWNIVKIENIPYNLDDDMLFEFLGKNPGLVPEEQGGVHIIMDRTTGKTMDCFLEFPTAATAERFVQKRYNNNRRCILGGRHISLELVKQGDLMRWLFPKTKGALWDNNGNLIVEAGTPQTSVEIISREELVMILGHARTPHRSPFSRKCLQRPYESLMSVITKFPWKETAAYTLRQRDLIFQAAFEAGELLKRQILRGKAGPNIDLKLLRRLCRTISFCPGFTYRQKLTFLDAMGITTTECFAILGDLGISHPLATQFQALTVKPGADYVAVEAIARLVAGGVAQQQDPDQDQSQSQSHSHRCSTLYNMGGEPGLPRGPGTEEGAAESSGGDVDLTMRAAAEIELRRVYAAIKTTFEKQNQEPILS
ncbi:hypothetical protein TWF696_006594 [Orbilia brochopaga]|uniref:RRM domain-containing protein n=1 Tax=Orbilia brochopaga TaxID=3140254 RepID=A0AAV9V0R2_9PEZI